MHGTAALRLDFVPDLLRVLGYPDPKQLERRLHDRIELAKLRKATDDDLAELKDAAAWVAERSAQPAPDEVDDERLIEVVKEAKEKEREVAEDFRRVVVALKGALESADGRFEADVQQLLRDSIEVLEGWLAFYRGFYTMLARQAETRRTSHKVLQARPATGNIDYAELSREHIARYPKIRAALAK